MIKYDSTKVSHQMMVDALWSAGLEDLDPPSFGEIFADFLSDTYWNDPKCISRRLSSVRGDPYAFFEYFKNLGYTFDL